MVQMTAFLMAAALMAGPVPDRAEIRTCAPLNVYKPMSAARMEYCYKGSLAFPVDGVVESALREIALFKLVHPDAQSRPLYEQVAVLAQEGRSPAIRYKAALVKLVFEHPGLFGADMQRDYLNDEQLFTAISDRLRDSLLAIVIR